MGVVASVVAAAAFCSTFLSLIFTRVQSDPFGPSPTLAAIEAQAKMVAEISRVNAERAEEEMKRMRAEEEEKVRRRAEEEEARRRRAEEEMKKWRADQEEARRRADEEMGKARAEQEAAQKRANEETARARAEKEKAERASAAADEASRKAKAEQEDAQRKAAAAEAEANEARAARLEAERKWREGIQPVVWPTMEELEATKERLQYTEGIFHFAIAGIAGSGKSSLINALRGFRNGSPGAAPTGVAETTTVITRYPDPNAKNPFVWYDVPGAGTLTIRDWEYFNEQGLYILDCIIVLFDNRFTATDVAILKNCARFNIPSYIVRSKSNQHILNMMTDKGYSSDDTDEQEKRQEYFMEARAEYITETRRSVRLNLDAADLPQQRVYIVAKDALLAIVKGKKPKDAIDEWELLEDLLSEAHARRTIVRPS